MSCSIIYVIGLIFTLNSNIFLTIYLQLASDIETHTTCVISTKAHEQLFHGDWFEVPTISIECDLPMSYNRNFVDIPEGFVKRLIWGINNGCAVRHVISERF